MPPDFPSFAEPRVVYADEKMMAILKPERMHTVPLAATDPAEANLCAWTFARYPELARAAEPGSRRPEEGGLLQRLDFETSGLVLFARTPEARTSLAAAQAAGNLRKEYLLFAEPTGVLEPRGSRPGRTSPRGLAENDWATAVGAGPVSAVLARLDAMIGSAVSGDSPAFVESRFRPYGPRSARVACLGDPAPPSASGVSRRRSSGGVELYRTELLEARMAEGVLELRVGLVRGFRHQIRAHLAWIGLPIVGDTLYGGAPGPRLCLHAFRLVLRLPSGETRIEC